MASVLSSAEAPSAHTLFRPNGRAADELRPVRFTPGYVVTAEGSVLIEFGDTQVLCTASVEETIPPFLRGKGQGWVTAEYGMLPRSTHTRSAREAARGKQTGRTQEIQRLIGRSLRAVTDLKALGERTITVDCDVLQADGGTRTASITGGYVALARACESLVKRRAIAASPLHGQIAAISVGIVGGIPVFVSRQTSRRSLVARLDGVILAGGLDVDPSLSGATSMLSATRPYSLLGSSSEATVRLSKICPMPAAGTPLTT